MYEFASTAAAHDAVWKFMGEYLRERGVAAPAALARSLPIETLWRSPGLLFGQTCGYPYRHGLTGVVDLIATPVYAFEGCEGPRHCSFIVVRRQDSRGELAEFRGARAAINARDSNSGMNLFRAALAPLAQGKPFFSSVIVTGAHAASLGAVAGGEADVAAIDCVTFGLISRGRPEEIADIRVLARTPTSPGLPFISSLALPTELRALVRKALAAALAERALREAWTAMGVAGAELLAPETYARINEIEAGAAELGYREVA